MPRSLRQYNVKFNEFEQNLLNDLKKIGWNNTSEIFRMALRCYHTELFGDVSKKRARKLGVDPLEEHERIPDPKYRAADEMPPEEYCVVALGGRVVEVEGVRCCEYPEGNLKRIRPLGKIKSVQPIMKMEVV